MKLITHYFLTLLVFTTSYYTHAQNQNNQWRFGTGGAIDFNTVPPSFVPGCPIATNEGSASVADRITGALLFYTDGVTVWGADNQVMPNGTGLTGGTPILLSSTTAAVIIPKPGSSNLYYIVTIDEQSSNNGVRYSVVDMNLNGGLGDIVAGQKNIPLFQTSVEKLEVVPASDGASFWLLTHDGSNSFYSFKVNSAGIQNTPVISANVGSIQGNGAGHMKINRQFNKLAVGNLALGSGSVTTIELFDFDNTTGIVSNPTILKYNFGVEQIYGVEFSPNGKVLYVTAFARLIQYDLTQPDALSIENTAYQVTTDLVASLQLGKDDKIYVNAGSINAINCPNKLGAACGYQTNAIANQTGGGGYGLPKWVYYADDIAELESDIITYSDTCLGNTTLFSVQTTALISNITWNFGDPASGANNTATGFIANHTFSQAGNYTIRAILTNACGFDTLLINALSIIDCNATAITGIKIVGDTCESLKLDLQAVGTSNSPYFFWDFGDPASGENDTITITGSSPAPFPTHTFSAPGIYEVCVTFQEPGSPASTICRTISIGLCCNGVIASMDSCLQNNIPFSIETDDPVTSILWNFDDPGSGVNNTSTALTPTHVFSATGTYNVRAIINFSCGIDTLFQTVSVINCGSIEADCPVFFPNVFSPNGDGANDDFHPLKTCLFESYECLIFNRWGELIFRTTDQDAEWDGKYRGVDCPIDVYVYVVNYKFPSQEAVHYYGSVTLLR